MNLPIVISYFQCLIETMLLSGGTPYANFRDLAHAWGRDRGFHNSLTSIVCERRGEVDRKKRTELGKRKAREEAESREKMEQLIAIENAASTLQCLPVSNSLVPMPSQPQSMHIQQQQQPQQIMPAPAPIQPMMQTLTMANSMPPPMQPGLQTQIQSSMPPPMQPGLQTQIQSSIPQILPHPGIHYRLSTIPPPPP